MTFDEARGTLSTIPGSWDKWEPSLILDFLSSQKKNAVAIADQVYAKQIWFLEETIRTHTHYIKAFKAAKQGAFYEAWCDLAQVEISLDRLARHQGILPDEFHISFIDKQIKRFQSAFPYRLFISPELLINKRTCTVCNATVGIRNTCGHRVGEVYDGIYCTRIHHIAGCISISLVTNPVQKYSVLRPAGDDNYSYSIMKFIIERLSSPYHGWSLEWSQKRHPHERFKDVNHGNPCPCGSEINYKECCLTHPDGVLRPHCQIYFDVAPSADLSMLTYSDR